MMIEITDEQRAAWQKENVRRMTGDERAHIDELRKMALALENEANAIERAYDPDDPGNWKMFDTYIWKTREAVASVCLQGFVSAKDLESDLWEDQ